MVATGIICQLLRRHRKSITTHVYLLCTWIFLKPEAIVVVLFLELWLPCVNCRCMRRVMNVRLMLYSIYVKTVSFWHVHLCSCSSSPSSNLVRSLFTLALGFGATFFAGGIQIYTSGAVARVNYSLESQLSDVYHLSESYCWNLFCPYMKLRKERY
jgi:hypothetical protein